MEFRKGRTAGCVAFLAKAMQRVQHALPLPPAFVEKWSMERLVLRWVQDVLVSRSDQKLSSP